jgi:hypothetical protein
VLPLLEGILEQGWVSDDEACSMMRMLVQQCGMDMHAPPCPDKDVRSPAEMALVKPAALQMLVGLGLKVSEGVLTV